MTSASQKNISIPGFSLIELMIAIIIASVLTAMAISAYRDHMLSAKIAEATSQLSIMKLLLEQYYQDHRNYGDLVKKNTCGITLENTNNFSYACTTDELGQTYLLVAEGRKNKGTEDFKFSVNEVGEKSTINIPTDWGDRPLKCWVSKRGMTC